MTNQYPSVFTAVLLFAVSNLTATQISSGIVNPSNGNTYILITTNDNSWITAEAEAVSLGGHLVAINDAEEQAWVYSQFSNYEGIERYLWIGLTDRDTEGTFTWTNGDPVTYTNWGTGEPNGAAQDEDYTHMWSPESGADAGKWNDNAVEKPGYAFAGVVEIPKDPQSGDPSANFTVASNVRYFTVKEVSNPGGTATFASTDFEQNGTPIDISDFLQPYSGITWIDGVYSVNALGQIVATAVLDYDFSTKTVLLSPSTGSPVASTAGTYVSKKPWTIIGYESGKSRKIGKFKVTIKISSDGRKITGSAIGKLRKKTARFKIVGAVDSPSQGVTSEGASGYSAKQFLLKGKPPFRKISLAKLSPIVIWRKTLSEKWTISFSGGGSISTSAVSGDMTLVQK